MKNYDCKTCAVSARQSQGISSFFVKFFRKGKEQTAPATVKSHRMASARFPTRESTWDYLVTFVLEDGKEVELNTAEIQFKELKDGQSGNLTWNGDAFLSFEQEV